MTAPRESPDSRPDSSSRVDGGFLSVARSLPAPAPGVGARVSSPVRPTATQIALFLATVGSTLLVGALHEGMNPFLAPATLARGIPFAATLLSILFVHEMGHYVAARRSGVEVTLPYFIPAPTLLGTFGAFIRMRSPVTDR